VHRAKGAHCLHLTGVSREAWTPAGKPTRSEPETPAETGQAAPTPLAREGAAPAATTGTLGAFAGTRQQATHAVLAPAETLAASALPGSSLAADRHQAIAGLPTSAGETAAAIDGTLEALLAARIGKRAAFDRTDAEDLRKLRDHCPSRQTVCLEAPARSRTRQEPFAQLAGSDDLVVGGWAPTAGLAGVRGRVQQLQPGGCGGGGSESRRGSHAGHRAL